MRFGRTPQQSGQAMVESALALAVLVIVVFGIVDFGRAYARKESVTDAVHRGLRYAEIHPLALDGSSSAPSNTIEGVIQQSPDVAGINNVPISGSNSGIDITYWAVSGSSLTQCGAYVSGSFTPSSASSTCPVSGNVVKVTVQSRLNLLTPIVQAFFPGGALVVNVSAEAPIE